MKTIELMLWLTGVFLIASYVGAHAWGERVRQQGVTTFLRMQETGVLVPPAAALTTTPLVASANANLRPSAGTVLAVLRIPGIALEVPVSYGTQETALRRGAGLIEGTAMPGTRGNVAIAAHRDTFFRGLKDVAPGDLIELNTLDHTQTYRVTNLSVVEPADVHVLADTGEPVLTLVTCYPFYFVGNAPQRFIVRAEPDDVSI